MKKPPFGKGGGGGILQIMLHYDKRTKKYWKYRCGFGKNLELLMIHKISYPLLERGTGEYSRTSPKGHKESRHAPAASELTDG